jgi:hypothetical protein
MTSATITFTNGARHTCRFPSSYAESPWLSGYEPRRERVNGMYQTIPGIEHKPVVRHYFLGVTYTQDEWTAYRQRGLI